MNKIKISLTFFAIILMVFQSCKSSGNKEDNATQFERIDSLKTNSNPMDSIKLKTKSLNIESKPDKVLSNECSCRAIAYVTKSPKGGIELLSKEKKVVKRFYFDEENEEFAIVELKNYNGEMFQVYTLTNPFSANRDDDNEYLNLWIENKDLRIFLPDNKEKVNLFSEPNEESTIINEVSAREKYFIQPIKCCKKWIFGIYNDKNGNQSKGWFHPDDICSSPITNC
jgi:hypothetical protein